MKRVVACLVLAIAVAGCGSGVDSPLAYSSWQREWRAQTARDLGDYELIDRAFLQDQCANLNAIAWNKWPTTGRLLDEILADFGFTVTNAIRIEATDIFIDEVEDVCP